MSISHVAFRRYGASNKAGVVKSAVFYL